jgi:hypothetical protein
MGGRDAESGHASDMLSVRTEAARVLHILWFCAPPRQFVSRGEKEKSAEV